jgi:NAD(P)H-hydrate epimerase
MRVLNAVQMREADRVTIEELGLPSIVLMENAGRQVVAAMEASYGDLAGHRVAVLAGRGNNGGDGFVVARTIVQRGGEASVFLFAPVADVRGDARINLEILGRLTIPVIEITDEQAWELHFSDISKCSLIVDAIFGTGLRTGLEGLLQTVVADVNSSGIPVVAVDLPSGLSADSHEPPGDAIEAALTVTLAAPKVPLILPPADRFCGDLVIADIGIPESVVDALDGPHLEILTRDAMRERVLPRAPDTHKGDYGRVLIVGGSLGKTGAAHLAALGALRSGAGLTTVATARAVLPIVAALGAEYTTEALEADEDGCLRAASLPRVLELKADVIAAGPGLGTSDGVRDFVHGLVQRSGVPLVLDADALNAFAGDTRGLRGRDGLDVIVTPHPGEMARLVGASIEDVQQNRVEVAREFAMTHHVYVVLKGHRSLIATPEGHVAVNLTGNPGMATGGSGDVLTGMIAAWFAQLLDAEAACQLAVYLHGLAGDLAEADDGPHAMTAGDIVVHLGDAVLELTARQRRNGPGTSAE